MLNKKAFAYLLLALVVLVCLCSCKQGGEPTTEPVTEQTTEPVTDTITDPVTDADIIPAEPEPVDVETVGGAVLVGTICMDEAGWYFKPEQPLNVTYEFFLGNPSVFLNQTRICMFDPKDDGVEKALYLGQTVTVSGTFRFFRDDFETLYFSPYTLTLGKTVPQSYGAPELEMPSEPQNRYDPSKPLPKRLDVVIEDGRYVFNPYMLSLETIEFMGNDFAWFYVEFVDAFLNYKSEVECPDKNYAEMLSTIIYYEFPLYNACAEPFEFVKHYDAKNGTVSISYKYDKASFDEICEQFFNAANVFLTDASPNQTDEQNAKAVYHALCTRMSYDYSALETVERKESYYAYLYNSGVCVTFANVYNQLLTRVGIKTSAAHCDIPDTIGHSWSIVELGGELYFCDPTYELPYDGGAGYRFFGMSYAERTSGGLGVLGIRYGRYHLTPLTPEMIAEKSLSK